MLSREYSFLHVVFYQDMQSLKLRTGQEVVPPSARAELEQVLRFYQALDISMPRADVQKMIKDYPNWQKRLVSFPELGKMEWFVNWDDPEHISQILTDQGKKRQLLSVARRYEELKKNGEMEQR